MKGVVVTDEWQQLGDDYTQPAAGDNMWVRRAAAGFLLLLVHEEEDGWVATVKLRRHDVVLDGSGVSPPPTGKEVPYRAALVHTGLSVVFRECKLAWDGWAKDVADREADRILKSTSSLH